MQLLSLRDALARAKLPRATYYRWRACGEFPEPDLRVNSRSVCYLRSTIDAWLAQHHGERSAV